MPITLAQKTAAEEVINVLLAATAPQKKRKLSAIFMDLVDREEWADYYEVIPEPRCLTQIRMGVDKGRYKNASDIYTDLSLVFWNALYYNEPGSQIALDAETLKNLLEVEWKKRQVLPIPRSSPPPAAPQKVHKVSEEKPEKPPSILNPPAPPTPARTSPVPHKSTPVPTRPTPAPAPSVNAAMAVSTPRTATPISSNVLPSGSTSNTNYAYNKPVPLRPRSAQRLSPDLDVDILSQDSHAQGDDFGVGVEMVRDADSDEIVKQLEKGFPRWPGFDEEGWMNELNLDRMQEIIQAIKSYKDIIGNRLSVALESVPEESTLPNISTTAPLSLKTIEAKLRNKSYARGKEFDMEVSGLFLKARRWHDPGTEPYSQVLLLQRLYQALTSANPPPGPPYTSSTNFAALPAGPGNIKPVHGSDGEGVAGVTSHRVTTKDRKFLDEVHYKGWTVRLADWLHLSNPDDPGKPIIGQVFRCWMHDEFGRSSVGVTVSWYFRPEQTYHSSNRKFWEGEVFKTSHFADHPLEDIIEKIACQFTARHIRGRPRPPYWYVGFPLYVCDSRYNDRNRVFVKIKNWNSCIPEEVRQNADFMPIYPFERTVFPNRFPSPFLIKGASKGPGGLVQATESKVVPARRTGDGGPNKGLYIAPGGQGSQTAPMLGQAQYQLQGYPQQQQDHRRVSDRSVITAAGGLAAVGGNAGVAKLPQETTKYFDRDPETNEMLWFASPPLNMARPPKAQYSLSYLHFLATKRQRDAEDDDAMDLDSMEQRPAKQPRQDVPLTVTEIMRRTAKDLLSGTQTAT